MRILVVDDEPGLLRIWKGLFEELGVAVHTAVDGVAATESMQRETFDALITDIRMPVADGLHVLRYAHSELATVPDVFVCSGYIDDEVNALESFKVVRVIRKPFSFSSEHEYFRSYVSKHSAWN